jgi:hypothetical protein
MKRFVVALVALLAVIVFIRDFKGSGPSAADAAPQAAHAEIIP